MNKRVSCTEGNGEFTKKGFLLNIKKEKNLKQGVRLARRKNRNEKKSKIKKIFGILVEYQESCVSGDLSCWKDKVK